jgi:hypothetical protein
MKQMTRIVAILGIVLPMFASCKTISDFLDKGEVVAKVGDVKLKMEDLQKVIPNGISAEDSVAFARQYINSWALDQVFLNVAESQLSPAELDVSKELEAYRKALLKYRYEQLYVNQRLDTLIVDDQIQEFYEQHQERFILQRPVVKARFMNISSKSPMLKMIQKKMSSDDVADVMEADSMAMLAAFKYTTWDDAWIDAATLAKEFGSESAAVLSSVRKGWIEISDTTGIMNVAYISDMVPAGKLAPREYSESFIRDMIISARKQMLIYTLEQDLLNDARESGKFEILK